MTADKPRKLLLIMPPYWDPICPPQGIVCLKSYLQTRGHEVHIADFNTDGRLFALQRKYFDIGTAAFPHWGLLNVSRNGPRYFARHQLAWYLGRCEGSRYEELARTIINMDGRSAGGKPLIEALDGVIAEGFRLVESKTRELVESIKPDVVGCTMLESTFPSALAVLKEAKTVASRAVTILGGPGMVLGNSVEDGSMHRVMERCGWVDAIIHGEGERLLEEYLAGSFSGRRILSMRDLAAAGESAGRPGGPMDVADLPEPDFGDLPLGRYLWLSVYSSRGCPYQCAFCFENRYWVRFRKKAIARLVAEMKTLAARHRKRKFYLCDSLANPVATPLSGALVAEGADYRWDCYMRTTAECRDEEKVRLWARGGMERVRIGVESASARVLGLMNKNVSAQQTAESLELYARNGIFTTTLWIAGFPGEREEDFQESMKFLGENHRHIYQADAWEFVAFPPESSCPSDGGFSVAPVYPAEFEDLLPVRYYDVRDGVPAAERFRRIAEFEKLRISLGVPNPYSVKELVEAAARWTALGHRGARRGSL
jgi:hypothetical protein